MMEIQSIVRLPFEYPNMVITENIEDDKIKSSIFAYSKIAKEDVDKILNINPLSTFMIILGDDILNFSGDNIHFMISSSMLDKNVDIIFRVDKLLNFEEYVDLKNKTKEIDNLEDKCILIL